MNLKQQKKIQKPFDKKPEAAKRPDRTVAHEFRTERRDQRRNNAAGQTDGRCDRSGKYQPQGH